MKFTEEQLNWFRAYKEVQMSGEFNMIMDSARAMKKAGLNEKQYRFVIGNYSKLREQEEA